MANWSLSDGRMLVPLHEVRILVLVGLTKHPFDAPICSISVQKNSTSLSAIVDAISSM